MLRAALLFPAAAIAVLLVGMATGRAETPAYLAVAMSCPAALPGSDCTRDTALDVVIAPAGETDCPKVAQVLATHLNLPAGGYHKLRCERRKG